ncbi:protein RESTRICTED TEV MOVEMENT 2 [Diospyros lotus]|uniref:protein RESTRICTED TEV MOVEMENT 2 n=1 Tax=Diospyros lotus TaxID=55363 RepID=UPI0022561957|nr:protein RESTRICTED TEV MOVEMENT 2 [Diospyros lotus]
MASRLWDTRTRDAGEEGFKPIREWKQEEQFLFLVVYLPGFTREQLNVSTQGINTLRIRGWRLINSGRRQSFQEEFELPQECSMAGIRAKFEGGILTITIPKKTSMAAAAAAAVPPARDTRPKEHQEEDGGDRFRATPKRDGASATPHSKPKQYQEEDGGDKGSATPRRDDASTVKQEAVKPKQTDISKSSEATKKGPEKQAADSKREITESAGEAGKITVERKARAEGKGQPTESKFDEKKGQENSIAKPRNEENMVPKKEEEAKEAGEVTASGRGEKGKENPITSPRNEQNMVTKKEEKAKEAGEVTASGGHGGGEKGKKHSITRPRPEEKAVVRYEREEEKAKEAGEIRDGGSGFNLEKYAEAVKGFAKGGLKEETQLMVNMGAAVLVIVALGAYISFTYFGKPKN